MKLSFVQILSVILIGILIPGPQVAGQDRWVKLFDGKTFTGWHTIPGGEWKVEGGAIVGTSPASDERHGLLVTDKTYGDFELRIQYKALQGNSGLYFRVDEVGGIVGVYGFQAEIDPARDAGGLYETGGRAWVVQPDSASFKKWYKPGEWNSMSVIAKGNSVKVVLNGYVTADLPDDPGRRSGHIALQLHGGMNMHVMFRNIELKEL
jgi:hypothetical protein